MKRYALSLILVLVCVSNLLAQSTAVQPFDVRRYGAKGDGATNDTTAIQNAIDAAEAAASSTVKPTVLIPRGTYLIRNLTIDTDNVALKGDGAELKQTTGGVANQMLYLNADDLTVQGLTLNGAYDAGAGVVVSGDGIGINISGGDRIHIEDVYVQNVKGEGCSAQVGCDYITFENVHVIDPGTNGFRCRADHIVIDDCFVKNWNVTNTASGVRAIKFDGPEADFDRFEVFDTRLEMTADRVFSDALHIDCGDNAISNGDSESTPFGSSGVATANKKFASSASNVGKASWVLDAGHGFAVNDGLLVRNSGDDDYDGMSHKIIALKWSDSNIVGDGNVYVRSIDANTITLHPSSADAVRNTNAINLTSSYTGTVYICAERGKRIQITGVDTSTERLTVTAHGYVTGVKGRLSRNESTDDALPGGLADACYVVVNTDYLGAGTAATYERPKRIRNVTLRDVHIYFNNPTTTDSNGIKTNNIENLVLDRVIVHKPYDNAAAECTSWRLGQGLRKVVATNCRFSHCITNNVISKVPDLTIDNCEIGDAGAQAGATYATVAIKDLQADKFTLTNSTLRFTVAAIEVATATSGTKVAMGEFRDEDCEGWVIKNNTFEAHSNARARVLLVNQALDMAHTGLLMYYNNERRNVGTYAGLTFTAASNDTVSAALHTLETGDEVRVATTTTIPAGLSEDLFYFIRRTGDGTMTFHTTAAAASDPTATPVDITDAGTGTHTMYSPKIGCQLSNNVNRDFQFFQKTGDGRQFIQEAAPSTTTLEYKIGDIVWNMNPGAGDPPGWVCTKTGVVATTAATFAAMPSLANNINALHSSTTEVGNVGTGVDDLMSYTLPANALLASGDSIEIEAGFTFAANGNNKQVKLLIGGSEYYASGAVAQNSGSMVLKLTVIYDTSLLSKFSSTVQTTGSGAIPNVALVNGGVLDPTTTNIIKCTGEATSNNDVVQEYLRVRYTPAP